MWLVLILSLAFGKELVTWVDPHQPPFYYIRNQEAKGSLDALQSDISKALPDYRHIILEVSFANVEKTMKEGRNLCATTLLKTDFRDKIAYMTAFFPIPPHHIIIRKGESKKFLPKKEARVSVTDLIEKTKMVGGFTPGRSYTQTVDGLIAKNRRSLNLKFYPPSDMGNDLLHLLEAGKIDYTLEYKTTADIEVRRRHLEGKFEILPLKEVRELLPVYIGCTRNEWGKRLIKEVDQVVQKYVTTSAYRTNVKGVISEETYKSFEKEIKEFIKKRSEGPWFSAPL